MNCKHCKGEFNPPATVSLTNCPFCQKPLIEVSDGGDNAKPNRILLEVTQRFSKLILGERKLLAYLKDLMPHVESKFINTFEKAIMYGVGKKLLELESEDASLRQVKIHTIKSSFRSDHDLGNTADYVVDCFLFSLGWIDKVEEKAAGIDVNVTNIIKAQLEKALEDGCLSPNETELLFSFGFQLCLTETAISQIISQELRKREFKPAKQIEKSLKTAKDILCFCDWCSEEYLKKHSKQKETNTLNQPNEFLSVKIGSQIWMKENLNVDRFRNGDPIPEVKNHAEWEKAGEAGQPAWCYYDNDPANGKMYGKLYNWWAVNDHRGLAPTGWRIPTDGNWENLIKLLGGKDVAGGKLKAKEYWESPNNGATNETGFSALPGGYRWSDRSFEYLGMCGFWWSSTERSSTRAWNRYMGYDHDRVHSQGFSKEFGFSLRCVRDID